MVQLLGILNLLKSNKVRNDLEMANEDYDHTSAEQLLSIIGRNEDLWD